MNTLVRQNVYGAYLDGDASATEALRSLCADYEELDSTYRQYEQMRAQIRDQISTVLAKLDGKAEIKGFGKLVLSEPGIVKGYDKDAIKALIMEWSDDFPEFAERLAACEKQTMRAGGLRIEREKA